MPALRRLVFLTLICCGLATAAWSGVRAPSIAEARVHLISKPAERAQVVWIDTARN
jgi:hypothetical protein